MRVRKDEAEERWGDTEGTTEWGGGEREREKQKKVLLNGKKKYILRDR